MKIRSLATNTIKKLRAFYFPAYGILNKLLTAGSVHDAIKTLEITLANQALTDKEILSIFKNQLLRVQKTSEALSNKHAFIKSCYEFIDAASLEINSQADTQESAVFQPFDYRHVTRQEFSMDENLLKLAGKKAELKISECPSDKLIGHVFNTIYIWDARCGKLLHTIPTQHDAIAKLLPISNTCLLTVGEYGDICIWDIPSSTLLHSIRKKNYQTYLPIDIVVKLSDDRFAIAPIHKPIEIWNTNGTCLQKIKIKSIDSKKYSEIIELENGKLLVALQSHDGNSSVSVWDTTSGKCIQEIETPFEVKSAIPRPDGTVLIYNRFEKKAGILDLHLGETKPVFADSVEDDGDSQVYAMLSSRYLLTTQKTNDGSSAIDVHEIFLKDLLTDKEYPLLTSDSQALTQEQIIHYQFNPKRPDVLFISYHCGYQGSALLIYDTTTGQILQQQKNIFYFKLLDNQSLLLANVDQPFGGTCAVLNFPKLLTPQSTQEVMMALHP